MPAFAPKIPIFANAMDKYSHIIDLPHWNPVNHKRMPLVKRASQFAAFAALSGHEEAIAETARFTMQHPDPEMRDNRAINARLAWLLQQAPHAPMATFTYFLADQKKEGGTITTYAGHVKRLSDDSASLLFTDGTSLALADILNIDSEAFNQVEGLWD